MTNYREVTAYMLDDICNKDLFPAGFIASILSYYYGNYDYSNSRAVKRYMKRGLIKRKILRNRMNKEAFYYYYK